MTDRSTGPRCGNNPNVQLTPGDRAAVADFKARLALQAAAKPYIERAAWVDFDPLMEVIASTLWKHCARDDEDMPQLVCDDPRTIAALAAAVARAEAEAMRERHKASLQRADEINNELMEEVQRYAAGTERPVLWSVYNRMYLRAIEAETRAEAMERAMESTAADALAHRGCHRELMAQCLRAERAEAEAERLRADRAEVPLSPFYEHPECGFRWHGSDDMDVPMRDGQPVCPRCELAAAEKRLSHSEKRCEELRTESKRRGKIKLEQAEQIRHLEKKLDEVRTQLGAEILRAGQAEAELRRLADETQQPDTKTLAPMFEGLHHLLATSSRDWSVYRVDAWLWAVLCGWDCEQAEHDDTCTHGALEETAAMHGWDADTVAKGRRYRAAVRALTEPAAAQQPKEA